MNEREFLELLNLYLDHEISAEDAVRLEAELRKNASRHAVYLDYCRMQNACKILATDFQQTGVKVARERSRELTAGMRPARQTGWSALNVAGASALAAACVLVVFSTRGLWSSAESENNPRGAAAVAERAPALADDESRTRLPVPFLSRTAPRRSLAEMSAGSPNNPGPMGERTLVSTSLVLSASKPMGAGLKVAVPVDEQLAWLRNFQLSSIAERVPVEPFRFETTPVSLRPEPRQLRTGSAAEAEEEIAAFRFLR